MPVRGREGELGTLRDFDDQKSNLSVSFSFELVSNLGILSKLGEGISATFLTSWTFHRIQWDRLEKERERILTVGTTRRRGDLLYPLVFGPRLLNFLRAPLGLSFSTLLPHIALSFSLARYSIFKHGGFSRRVSFVGWVAFVRWVSFCGRWLFWRRSFFEHAGRLLTSLELRSLLRNHQSPSSQRCLRKTKVNGSELGRVEGLETTCSILLFWSRSPLGAVFSS